MADALAGRTVPASAVSPNDRRLPRSPLRVHRVPPSQVPVRYASLSIQSYKWGLVSVLSGKTRSVVGDGRVLIGDAGGGQGAVRVEPLRAGRQAVFQRVPAACAGLRRLSRKYSKAASGIGALQQVALRLVAGKRPQCIQLRRGLHAFRDDFHVQRVRHGQDRRHDGAAFFAMCARPWVKKRSIFNCCARNCCRYARLE